MYELDKSFGFSPILIDILDFSKLWSYAPGPGD